MLTPEGFTTSGQFVSWSEIQEISAYKLDLLVTDEVRFIFSLDSCDKFEISEEQEGFSSLVAALTEQFPSIIGWQSKVILPAFKDAEFLFILLWVLSPYASS